MPAPRRLYALVFAAASGALLAAAQEPLALGWLAWLAPVPLLVALLREPRRGWGALCGLVSGLVFFGLHLIWIFHFGWMAWTALIAFMAAGYALFGWLAVTLRRLPVSPVLLAGAWVGVELVWGRWPWGGFAWGALGTSQGGVPGVRALAGVIGASGLSFLVVLVAAMTARRIVLEKFSWGSVALTGSVLALFVTVDAVRYGHAGPGRPVDVAVVQGGVPRPVRPDQDDRVFAGQVATTRRLQTGPRPDLVIWPESAIGPDTSGAPLESVAAMARWLNRPMLAGQAEIEPDGGRFVNLVRQVSASGRIVATYQKRHPVPFGEYVPAPALRRFFSTLGQVPLDMVPGSRPVVFDVGGVRIATPICFESAFSRDVRDFARAGAELIVVATNDASFERSYASRQHVAQSRMRALETRQWVVQAALSGSTAVIAPDGEVSHRTGLFRRALVRARVYARPARSLYARTGDLFAFGWAAAAGLALLLPLLARAPRRRLKPPVR